MSSKAIAACETFVDASGHEWVLSPIQLRDMKELESFLRWEPIRQIQELQGLSDADRRYLIDKAYAETRGIRIGTAAFQEAAGSLTGITHLLYLSLRRKQDKVTKAQVEDMLTTMDVALEFGNKLRRLMGVDDDDADPTKAAVVPTPPPTQSPTTLTEPTAS